MPPPPWCRKSNESCAISRFLLSSKMHDGCRNPNRSFWIFMWFERLSISAFSWSTASNNSLWISCYSVRSLSRHISLGIPRLRWICWICTPVELCFQLPEQVFPFHHWKTVIRRPFLLHTCQVLDLCSTFFVHWMINQIFFDTSMCRPFHRCHSGWLPHPPPPFTTPLYMLVPCF